VILSADVDGLLSASIVASAYPVRVIGIYTTKDLVLLDGASHGDAARALWLDHDVSEPGVRCVGQHLVHHRSTDSLPRREPDSFNPNVWLTQAWEHSFSGRSGKKRDKYPYGTCHFLAEAMGIDPGDSSSPLSALLAHADGTWRTVVDYRANALIWFRDMFESSAFLKHLGNEWAKSEIHLAEHARIVRRLLEAGVSNSASRAKIASLLPEDLKALTGRQSIRYTSRNPQQFVSKVADVLTVIADEVETRPVMGKLCTKVIEGVVDTPYPDRIDDFDKFMLDNSVFSHAFTDLRTLRYTTGINLNG
jgi:hypothetical protein